MATALRRFEVLSEPTLVWASAALLPALGVGVIAATSTAKFAPRLLWLLAAMSLHQAALSIKPWQIPSSARLAMQRLLAAGLPHYVNLTPSVFPSAGALEADGAPTKRRCILLHPHGIYSMALKRSFVHEPLRPAVAFLDSTLTTLSPFVRASAFLCGFVDVQPLTHRAVEAVMKAGVLDVFVVAGGFVEASTGTNACNRVWPGRWPYWARQCLKHDYDVAVHFVHGGTQVFDVPEWGWRSRAAVAKKNIPCILHGLPRARAPSLASAGFVEPIEPHREEIAEDRADLSEASSKLVETLLARFRALLQDHPPPEGCAAVQLLPINLSRL